MVSNDLVIVSNGLETMSEEAFVSQLKVLSPNIPGKSEEYHKRTVPTDRRTENLQNTKQNHYF